MGTNDPLADVRDLMAALPDWGEHELLQLHPVLRRPLLSAVADARRLALLRVVPASLWRSNGQQAALRKHYEEQEALWKAGKLPAPPLPAACAGHSAHNWTVCTKDASHNFGDGDQCGVCGAEGQAASAAADVAILDGLGNHIRTGGAIADTAQPREWQLWFQVLELHKDQLRDGGLAYRDPVHVESVLWDDKAFTLNVPKPAPKPAPKKPVPPAPAAGQDSA